MKTKTHLEFLEEIKNISDTIEVLGIYKNAHTRIKFRCRICNFIWDCKPNSILAFRTGCPQCAINKNAQARKISEENFVSRVGIKNPHIEIISDYISLDSTIDWKCLICNTKNTSVAANILYRKLVGCENCCFNNIAEERKKPIEKIIQEMQEINADLEIIDEYNNGTRMVSVRCNVCGLIWDTNPFRISKTGFCPNCSGSLGEQRIRSILLKNNINFEQWKRFPDCKKIKCLPFDFFIPDMNMIIEYDGIQHFHPVEKFGGQESFLELTENDNIKNNYCFSKNIRLIRINYTQFKDIENILTNVLLGATNV